jgi:hypothetical protein
MLCVYSVHMFTVLKVSVQIQIIEDATYATSLIIWEIYKLVLYGSTSARLRKFTLNVHLHEICCSSFLHDQTSIGFWVISILF